MIIPTNIGETTVSWIGLGVHTNAYLESLASDSTHGGVEGVTNRDGGCLAVPVATGNNDILANIAPRETKIRGGKGPIRVVETSKVIDNGRVVASLEARGAEQVRTEVAAGCDILLEDDCLGFHLADLLCDDLFGDLLKHKELLLNNFDADRFADNFLLFNHDLFADLAGEVVNAVKVVKVIQRRITTPIVEG